MSRTFRHEPEARRIRAGDVVSVRDYFEMRLMYMEKEVKLASDNLRYRMDGFPEQFVKKGETGEILSDLKTKVEILMQFKDRTDGQLSNRNMTIIWWVAITGAMFTVLSLALRFFKV